MATHRAIKNLRKLLKGKPSVRRTSDLIDALVDWATPVRRLRPPLVRAGIWLALAAAMLALLCAAHGVRSDLAARLQSSSCGDGGDDGPADRGAWPPVRWPGMVETGDGLKPLYGRLMALAMWPG